MSINIDIHYFNHFIPVLKLYANEQGDNLVASCGVIGAHYALGGSLGYNAALEGCYDIDLRLLIPEAGKSEKKVHREIDAVKDLMVKRAKGDPTFKVKFIDEGGTNYIWHTRQIVKVPGIPGNPDVKLTWNIQAESTYRGIAEMAARLPRELIDRYVVAKGKAREESEEAYKETKKQWVDFINWLIDNGGKKTNDQELEKLLESCSDKLPSFLKLKKV